MAGGGLAGAASASLLAAAGRRVVLVERDAGARDKICGEFLSHEAQRYLRALGLDLTRLGGHPIGRVRLVGQRGGVAEAMLPFHGLGLSRRRLDAALLDHAAACGVELRLGQRVRRIAAEEMELDGGHRLRAPAVLLATGKHDLRDLRRPTRGPGAALVGFKSYFTLAQGPARAIENTVEVIMLRDGYAGLQRIEDSRANLCLLVSQARVGRLGGDWAAILAELLAETPHLRARLAGAGELLARPLTIARVPYGFLHRPRAGDPPGPFRLGDQMAVIPSFSGDGMSIALHSAAAAAARILAGDDADAYHRQMRRDLARQMRLASLLQMAGGAALGKSILPVALRLFPALLGRVAAWTRVPEDRLLVA